MPITPVWLRARLYAPPLTALALSSGALFNGYNSLFGQAACYLVNAVTVVALLAVYRPNIAFWRQLVPVFVFLGLAALWVTLVNYGVQMVPGMGPPVVYARDMFDAEMLGYLAGLLALLCGMILGRSGEGGRSFLHWLVLFNALWLFCGLLARGLELDDYFAWSLSRQGRFTGTIGNANVTATLAGAMALIAAGELLREIREYEAGVPARLLVWATALVILLGAMISTAARFAAVFEVVMMLALLRTAYEPDARQRRILRWLVMGAAATAFALVLAGGSMLAERFASLSPEMSNRLMMWSHYAELAMRAPVYGYGLGSFPSLNSHFLADAEMAQAIWRVNSAHNIVLQLMLNGGLPYLAAVAGAALLIGWRIARGLVRSGWPLLMVAPVLAMAQILLCAMVDIALDVPATVMVLAALAGAVWSRASRVPEEGEVAEREHVRFKVTRSA